MKVDYTYEAYGLAQDIKSAYEKGFLPEAIQILHEAFPDISDRLNMIVAQVEIAEFNKSKNA